MEQNVINPVLAVKVRGQDIQVKELTWKDALKVVSDLTSTAMGLVDGSGKITATTEKIAKAIMSQETLLSWVLTQSTGQPKDWVDKLTVRELLPLVDAIVQLNMSKEVVASGKEVAGRVGEVFDWKSLSLGQSTSSSAPVTPSKTLKP